MFMSGIQAFRTLLYTKSTEKTHTAIYQKYKKKEKKDGYIPKVQKTLHKMSFQN